MFILAWNVGPYMNLLFTKLFIKCFLEIKWKSYFLWKLIDSLINSMAETPCSGRTNLINKDEIISLDVDIENQEEDADEEERFTNELTLTQSSIGLTIYIETLTGTTLLCTQNVTLHLSFMCLPNPKWMVIKININIVNNNCQVTMSSSAGKIIIMTIARR